MKCQLITLRRELGENPPKCDFGLQPGYSHIRAGEHAGKEQHHSNGRTSYLLVIWAPLRSCAVPVTAGRQVPSSTRIEQEILPCPCSYGMAVGPSAIIGRRKYHQSSEWHDFWVSPSQSTVRLQSSYHTERDEELSCRSSHI